MKAKLILAETATTHPDGTVSLLRAGINHLWGTAPPYGLQGVLLLRLEAGPGDAGDHKFDLRCMDVDGGEAGPRLEGQFSVPKGGGVQNLMLRFGLGFQKTGKYTFYARVDGVELDNWWVVVSNAPPGEVTP